MSAGGTALVESANDDVEARRLSATTGTPGCQSLASEWPATACLSRPRAALGLRPTEEIGEFTVALAFGIGDVVLGSGDHAVFDILTQGR